MKHRLDLAAADTQQGAPAVFFPFQRLASNDLTQQNRRASADRPRDALHED